MMRSMYASVSGLKVHQTMMDVIGNNISNVNTIGYKGSRVTFKEMLNQTLRGASAPDMEQGKGGTNPLQVGLGVSLGSIDADMTSGNLLPTSKQSDVAIQGDGFFIVSDGQQDYYTRVGSFSFDKEGYLYSSINGYRVQGWVADERGNLGTIGPDNITDIVLDKSMTPQSTQFIDYEGNLNAAAENKMEFSPSKVKVTNAGGDSDTISISLKKTEDYNRWEFELTCDDPTSEINGSGDNSLMGYIALNADGEVISIEDGSGNDLIASGIQIDVKGSGDIANIALPTAGNDLNEVVFLSGDVEDMSAKYELNAQRTITANVYDTLGKQHAVSFTMVKTNHNRWELREDSVQVSDGSQPGAGFLGGVDPHIITFDDFGEITGGQNLDLTFTPFGGGADQTIRLDFTALTQFEGNMTADFGTIDGYPQGDFQSFVIDPSGTITGSFSNGQTKVLAKVSMAMFSNPAGLTRDGELFTVSNNSGLPRIGEPGVNGRGSLAPGNLEMSNVDLAQQFTDMITSQRGFQANSKIITTSDEMLQQVVNMKR